jgi:hypothetical protein
MPTSPDAFLTLAREMAEAGDERHWRESARCSHDAVHTVVAAALGLDPATFSGNPRAVADALFGASLASLPDFVRLARRHWNTLWLARLRAERDLADTVTQADAKLSLELAERVFAARRSGLQ